MKTNVVSDDWLFFACLAYGATAWLLQMYRVAAPRDWLLQRIRDIRARMKTDDWHGVDQALDNLAWHEQKLEKGWLFVPIPKVQAGWRYVHALEDEHVRELTSNDVVEEKLRTVECTLKGMRNSCAKQLAERIKTMLRKGDGKEARRALLQEAQVYVHNVSDKKYEDMAALLAKAVLLTIFALAIIATLGILFDRESFFVFGAAGALVSRLTRVLRRLPKASDYGAAWSTLILSPAGGALVGWLGVLIAAVLASAPFDVLEDVFSEPWDDAYNQLGFLIAFLGGFSERWFTRLVGVAETKLTGALPAEEATTPADAATEES